MSLPRTKRIQGLVVACESRQLGPEPGQFVDHKSRVKEALLRLREGAKGGWQAKTVLRREIRRWTDREPSPAGSERTAGCPQHCRPETSKGIRQCLSPPLSSDAILSLVGRWPTHLLASGPRRDRQATAFFAAPISCKLTGAANSCPWHGRAVCVLWNEWRGRKFYDAQHAQGFAHDRTRGKPGKAPMH